MQDEFTKKMHEEMIVSHDTKTKHVVWSLLSFCETSNKTIEEIIHLSAVTMEDVAKYRDSYFALKEI